MKLPRDVSGGTPVAALRRLGYAKVRQRGSHMRITTREDGKHHEVIPLHDPTRPKTLSSILKSIAHYHGIGVRELLRKTCGSRARSGPGTGTVPA